MLINCVSLKLTSSSAAVQPKAKPKGSVESRDVDMEVNEEEAPVKRPNRGRASDTEEHGTGRDQQTSGIADAEDLAPPRSCLAARFAESSPRLLGICLAGGLADPETANAVATNVQT